MVVSGILPGHVGPSGFEDRSAAENGPLAKAALYFVTEVRWPRRTRSGTARDIHSPLEMVVVSIGAARSHMQDRHGCFPSAAPARAKTAEDRQSPAPPTGTFGAQSRACGSVSGSALSLGERDHGRSVALLMGKTDPRR